MKTPVRRRLVVISAIAVAGGLLAGVWWFAQSRFNIVPSLVASSQLPQTTTAFPDISLTSATDTQKAIVSPAQARIRSTTRRYKICTRC